MSRYIDADKFKRMYREQLNCVFLALQKSLGEAIDNVPTADVRPNVHGEWKEVYAETDYRNGWIEFTCEFCEYQNGLESGQYGWHYGEPIPWNFCQNCGADMRKGAEHGQESEEH